MRDNLFTSFFGADIFPTTFLSFPCHFTATPNYIILNINIFVNNNLLIELQKTSKIFRAKYIGL
jgi:hypothetical protein